MRGVDAVLCAPLVKLWLEHYGYDEGDPTKQYWKESQSVGFDDVVVARQYIGLIQR